MLNQYLLSLVLSFSSLTLLPTIELADYGLEKADISPIENKAKAWAKKCAKSLTPEETQLLGNFLYFMIQGADTTALYVTDHAEFFELLKEYSHGIDRSRTIFTKLAEKSLQLKAHLSTGDSAIKCMKRCIAERNKQDNSLHEDFLRELIIEEEAFIKTIIKQKSEALFHLEKNILSEKQERERSSNLLEFIKNIKESLSSDELFAGKNYEDNLENYTYYLIRCTAAIHDYQAALFSTVNESESIKLLLNKLQNAKIIVYKMFYKELYQQIVLLDPEYQTIIFCPTGTLASEDRSVLPSPDSFFTDKKQ